MGRIEQNTDMANVADTAVVTGSSSGIGLALSRMLVTKVLSETSMEAECKKDCRDAAGKASCRSHRSFDGRTEDGSSKLPEKKIHR